MANSYLQHIVKDHNGNTNVYTFLHVLECLLLIFVKQTQKCLDQKRLQEFCPLTKEAQPGHLDRLCLPSMYLVCHAWCAALKTNSLRSLL